VNAEQASKRAMRKPTRLNNGEGCHRWGSRATAAQRFRRGSGDGMHVEGVLTQHGKPCTVEARDLQLATREGQAGPCGVAERPVVPEKPGNAGGGKGPQFKVSAESGESREIGHEPITSS
jgi:hypothetical protein